MSESEGTPRRVLAEFSYDPSAAQKGYTGQTLYVNLSDGEIASKEVTEEMKEKFVGGRGFGLWYLWHGVNDDTKWDDPENEIVISSGPCGGITQYPGSGKSLVVSISPLTNVVIDSNVGGHFGPLLKAAGFDTTLRYSLGADIAAACGQLVQRKTVDSIKAFPI